MVSFIIPTRNEEQYIKKAVASIYNNCISTVTFEIIIVDDASSDNTVKIIAQSYPDVRIIRTPERKGPAKTRNIGIENAKGEILCFMDADVWLEQNCVSELLKYIQHYDIVYTIPFFPNGLPIFPIFATRDYPVITALFVIKRAALFQLDKHFDEMYEIYNEDLDFFLRCRMFGLTSKYIESAKAYHWIKTSPPTSCRAGKNPELRYYMDLRNSIYGYLKFYGFGVNLVGFGTNKLILQNIKNLLWNKDGYNPIYFRRDRVPTFLRVWYKFFPQSKISKKTRFYIVFLILKAFIWNFFRRKEIINEHNTLHSKIKYQKLNSK